jgi:hypothetical protein
MGQAKALVFLYCRNLDKGVWVLPSSGMGLLSAQARQIMKDDRK